MCRADLVVLSDRLVLRLKLLILPDIREAEDFCGTFPEEFGGCIGVEASRTLELAFQGSGLFLVELESARSPLSLTMTGDKSACRVDLIARNPPSRPRVVYRTAARTIRSRSYDCTGSFRLATSSMYAVTAISQAIRSTHGPGPVGR